MSEWKKVEEPVGEPEKEPAELSQGTAKETPGKPADRETIDGRSAPAFSDPVGENAAVPAGSEPPPGETLSPKRYTASGRRKGHFRFAAPLGLLMILLALTGVVALVVTGVRAIRRARDDTPVKTELFEFLEPLLANYPIAPFADAAQNDQDALVLSAIWKITDAERIRMLLEKDENSLYPMDDMSRLIIPLSEVETAYHALFGPDAQPALKAAVGGEAGGSFTFEYIESERAFHVPATIESAYQAVADTLEKKGNRYILRIGFVLGQDIGVNEKGDTVSPTPDMAKYLQDYTLEKTDAGWKVVAVADVK